MATTPTLEEAASQYAEARTALNEATQAQKEAIERVRIARDIADACRTSVQAATIALESAAYPDEN